MDQAKLHYSPSGSTPAADQPTQLMQHMQPLMIQQYIHLHTPATQQLLPLQQHNLLNTTATVTDLQTIAQLAIRNFSN